MTEIWKKYTEDDIVKYYASDGNTFRPIDADALQRRKERLQLNIENLESEITQIDADITTYSGLQVGDVEGVVVIEDIAQLEKKEGE